MEEPIAYFCECPGISGHIPSCPLGKRLKIKYSDYIQKLWYDKGPEFAEEEVDRLLAEEINKIYLLPKKEIY